MSLSSAVHVEDILDTISTAVYALDNEWRFVHINKVFEDITQRSHLDIVGKVIWEDAPHLLDTLFYKKLIQAKRTKKPVEFETTIEPSNRWYRVRAVPLIKEMIVYFTEITNERKQHEIQRFLIKASEVLNSSLDYETTLVNVAQLAVPHIGDWCGVDMLSDDGSIKRLAVAHIDPKKIKLAHEFAEKYPANPESAYGVHQVLQTGKSELINFIPDELIIKSAINEEHLEMLKQLDIRSYMIVPLEARGRIFGAITLVSSSTQMLYTEADLAMAEELAHRAAIAVDNAYLHRATQRSKEQLEMAQKAAHIGSFEWNVTTKKARWTPELEGLYGLRPGGFNGKFENWTRSIHSEDRPLVQKEVELAIEEGSELNVEFRVLWPDNSIRWINAIAHLFHNKETRESMLVGINMDITERKRNEEIMRYQAFHDALTGLPNRLLLSDRLEVALQQARRRSEQLAVLFLDLDRFKDINDTLGHSVGDQLLKEVSQRLKSCLRVEDTVARFGGDEFLIVLPEIREAKDAVHLAKKIFNVLKKAVTINNREIHLNTSIGIGMYPHDGETVDTLLKNADAALYHAKESGRNRYQLYTQNMHMKASERLTLENDLRKALEREEFEVHYQPIVDLRTGEIIRAEALVRWMHPERGIITPDDFMPLAEETGLILPLGDLVLRKVCVDVKEWQKGKYPACPIAVNFSARQFSQDDLPEQIEAVLKKHKVQSGCLQVEITESVAMQNMTVSISKLKKLQEMGMQVAIDDFGTGYSSLSYLKRLPIERIKIDKSFVQQCTTDKRDRAIIQAIIALAHTLNLIVCAEGIEHKNQLQFLQEIDCDCGQGYYFKKPLTHKAFSKLLSQNKNYLAS